MGRKLQQIVNEKDMEIARLQKELAKSKYEADKNYRMLESINNSTHLAVWMAFFDEDGNQTDVRYTDEFRRMLGYNKQEMPDTVEALGKIIHPDDTEQVFASYGAAVARRDAQYQVNYRLLNKSGEYRMFHAAGECLRRKNGNPEVFIGTFTDIEDQLNTEAQLEHDQRRQGAVDLMLLEGSWSMDVTKYDINAVDSPMVFSDQFKNILGYSANSPDFPDIMQSWITRIHPDDVEGAAASLQPQLESPSGPAVADSEYRMQHKSGDYIWVRASSTVVWQGGAPAMVAGTILDITDEKKNRNRFKNEMAPNIEALTTGITNIAENVDVAAGKMKGVAAKQAEVSESAQTIEEAVDASMNIISSIQNIANQTNLLSLNASIEAARAGEAGKGFAVVADEVSKLAQSTKETTQDIADILNNMNASVKEILVKITEISDSVTEENAEMDKIDATVDELHASANEIAKMAASLYS